MRIVRIIQELSKIKRVIVIEHDLAVLDVLADLIHIVYGKKGHLDIYSASTRQAITHISWILLEQNVRIRSKPITFLNHRDRQVDIGDPIVSWGGLEKFWGFQTHKWRGSSSQSKVVGVVGPNGTGKSTMIKILAGEHEYDGGWSQRVNSYKPQHIDVDFDGSVQFWLDS